MSMNQENQEVKARSKSATWYGSKQISMMIYTGILMLIGACVVGGNTNTVLPSIAQSRGWDIEILVFWSGMSAIFAAVGNLIFSSLIPKLQPVRTIYLTLFGSAVCFVIFGTTNNITIFIIVTLLLGVLSGGYQLSGCMSLTTNWWPTKKGIVLGWTTLGYILSEIVYIPIMPYSYEGIGISGTHVVVALFLVMWGLLGVFFIKNIPEEAGTYPDGDEKHASSNAAAIVKQMREYRSPFTLAKILKEPSTWTISMSFFLSYVAAMIFIASQIPVLLIFGHSYSKAALVFAVSGIVSVPGSVILGVIDQELGTKFASKIYIVALIIGFILVIFSGVSIVAAIIGATLIKSARVMNLLPSYVGTKYGRWDYSAAYRVIGTIVQIGGGIGISLSAAFSNAITMYIFSLFLLAISFVLMIINDDSFIGKPN